MPARAIAKARAVSIRAARRADLPAIVRLLADDTLGRVRERAEEPLPEAYTAALAAVEAQPGNMILVAEAGGTVVGCLQLILIPSLTLQGTLRGQIEGVRVDSRYRGSGIGEQLLGHAIGLARAAGCGLVQLTTHKSRDAAHRFYARLGFVPSHVGMKLVIGEDADGRTA